MIKVVTIPVTPIQQNARLLICTTTNDAVVVDPGGDVTKLFAVMTQEKVNVREVWLTHSHFDHCGGVSDLLQHGNERGTPAVTLLGHKGEKEMRSRVTDIVAAYGLSNFGLKNCPEPDRYIDEGDLLAVGNVEFKVLFTPGHSPGHVCFYCEAENMLIAGDTLFRGSIGRTDFPQSSHAQLMQSIREKLLVLPGATRVLSGHGEDTTIGSEKANNPFLQ
jgi:hydroxyacylglutathione hydrolase